MCFSFICGQFCFHNAILKNLFTAGKTPDIKEQKVCTDFSMNSFHDIKCQLNIFTTLGSYPHLVAATLTCRKLLYQYYDLSERNSRGHLACDFLTRNPSAVSSDLEFSLTLSLICLEFSFAFMLCKEPSWIGGWTSQSHVFLNYNHLTHINCTQMQLPIVASKPAGPLLISFK